MDIFDALAARHMARAFTGVPPTAAQLDQLLYALSRAPSAGNTASVETLVLDGDDVRAYWDITLTNERREDFPWPRLLKAPVLLIPTVAPSDYVDRYGEEDKAPSGLGKAADDWSVPYWWVDGGAAVENLLLAASALQLGVCFFGQFDHEPAVSAHFAIPEGRRSLGTIAVGEPDPENDRKSRSSKRPARSVADRTHWGRW